MANHAVFLAEVPPLNELDLQPGRPRHGHGVIPQRIAQRFGKNAQVEAADAGKIKLSLQRRRMTDIQQAAGDNHPVEATQLTGDLPGVTRNQ